MKPDDNIQTVVALQVNVSARAPVPPASIIPSGANARSLK
jgi:hypothetical protein